MKTQLKPQTSPDGHRIGECAKARGFAQPMKHWARLNFWTTPACSLSATYLLRRGLGRGGSLFDGRFMGRRSDQAHPSPRAAGRGNVIGRAQRKVQTSEVRPRSFLSEASVFICAILWLSPIASRNPIAGTKLI